MRVVLDTNIYVSGLGYGGKPELVLDEMGLAEYTLLVSEDILMELEEVLSLKFGWSPRSVASALTRIRDAAEMVSPQQTVSECADPDDNRILEAALEGEADCIVSGDKHLLRMKSFRGIQILTASDFLSRRGA
jgi:putative PIN family toxin of toxin-antitoxin system